MGRKHGSAEEKAKIAIEALREDKPIRQIAQKYGVHPNQISTWEREPYDGAGDVFRRFGGSREKEFQHRKEELLRELGREHVEKAFLKKLRQLGVGGETKCRYSVL